MMVARPKRIRRPVLSALTAADYMPDARPPPLERPQRVRTGAERSQPLTRFFQLSPNVIASAAWQSRSRIDQRCRQLTSDRYVPIIETPWPLTASADGHQTL